MQHTASNAPSTSKSRPLFALGAGILAATAGCALWIFIAQKYQLLWMSAAVAFGIASAIRYAGNTNHFVYGIYGAFLSAVVALAGNLATAIFIVSKRGKTPAEILSELDVGTAVTFLNALLNPPMGPIFYAAAIFLGFWFSFKHPVKSAEVEL